MVGVVIVAVAGPVIVAVHVHGNATVGVIEGRAVAQRCDADSIAEPLAIVECTAFV